jgi:hypothetical protein
MLSFRRSTGALAAAVLFGAVLAGCLPNGSPAPPGALFVAPTGNAANKNISCATARYSTIASAIAVAPAGGTVVVCAGTYNESVNVSKPITLRGFNAVVDAANQDVGILISSSNSSVIGFTVRNARGEGILAKSVANVTISFNLVTHNNLDANNPNTQYPECQAQGQVPGDCGEGIHLMSATDSRVVSNHSTGNAGGILLTDELGPNHDNVVASNLVDGNVADCGITLPGHNTNALTAQGVRQPGVAGVYHNTIRDNTISGNGTQGEGAGVLVAASAPGTAAYENTIRGNFIAGNGLSGVTLHSHTPNQDINGNVISANVITRNNTVGDSDANVNVTTGVLVFSAVVPVTVQISNNGILADTNGIWVSAKVQASIQGNVFGGVTNQVVVGP